MLSSCSLSSLREEAERLFQQVRGENERQVALSQELLERRLECAIDELIAKGIVRKIATKDKSFFVLHEAEEEEEEDDGLRELLEEQSGLKSKVPANWQRTYKHYIDALHDYNELKDGGQSLLGRLAVARETTTRALYPDFGLAYED